MSRWRGERLPGDSGVVPRCTRCGLPLLLPPRPRSFPVRGAVSPNRTSQMSRSIRFSQKTCFASCTWRSCSASAVCERRIRHSCCRNIQLACTRGLCSSTTRFFSSRHKSSRSAFVSRTKSVNSPMGCIRRTPDMSGEAKCVPPFSGGRRINPQCVQDKLGWCPGALHRRVATKRRRSCSSTST